MESIDTSKYQKAIIILAVVFYIMEGILFNPAFLWVATPLIFSFLMFKTHGKSGSVQGIKGVKVFLYTSGVILGFVHFAWFFDLGGTKTGSSTSALIFAVIPFYTFIIGGLLYFVTYKSKNNENRA